MSQSPDTILSRIVKVYQGDFTVTVNATYRYYPDYYSHTVTDSMKAILIMHGNNYYFKLGDIEMMRQNEYYIMADQSSKKLSVSESLNSLVDEQPTGMLDMLLKQHDVKLTSFNPGKGLKGIIIYYIGSEIVQATIIADEHNYIKKCILRYQKDIDWANKKVSYSKLEIIYGEPMVSNTSFPANQYGLNRFVQLKKDGSFQVTPKYNKYELTDNTD